MVVNGQILRDGQPPLRGAGVTLDVELQSKAELRVGCTRSPTAWLINSPSGSLIHIGQRLPLHVIGKDALHTGSHLRWMSSEQCQVAQDAMVSDQKDTSTVSTNTELHVLLEAARLINYHVIALQEIKSRRTDVKQLSDDTLSCFTSVLLGSHHSWRKIFITERRSCGFFVQPSVVHLVDSQGSYNLAWLSFDSVHCIRRKLVSSAAIFQHQS
ncbi:unnamed protein product [Strongylus vulgaris]|uniref:Endonuclease/exonuclease/phosphatase domain-containing protein n=1 Tax=Strongylus vulgaris TaxID=40348 RepID=A0A3P7I4D9_STRVU|nr:unnamed protein product [Strongylus vulgaris]